MMSSTPGGRLRIGPWHLRRVAGLAAILPLGVFLWAAPGQGHAAAAAVTRAGPADASGLVVATDKGKIQGKSAEGIDQFLGIVQVGQMPHEDCMSSIRMFGEEVIPRFR